MQNKNLICAQCKLNAAERIIKNKQIHDKEDITKYSYVIEIEDLCSKCRWFNMQQAGLRLINGLKKD